MLPGMGQNLDAFIEKWAASGAAERANKDMFLAELCGKDLTKVDLFLVRSATDAHDVAGRRLDLPMRLVPNICPRQPTCTSRLPTA